MRTFGLIGGVAWLRDNPDPSGRVLGQISGVRMIEIVGEYLDDFLSFAIQGRD